MIRTPRFDVLEDRKLMSNVVIDTSIPIGPGPWFSSNSFHNVNGLIPKTANNPTPAALSNYVAQVPFGQTQLLPQLEADVATFLRGGSSVTTAQATTATTAIYQGLLFRDPTASELATANSILIKGAANPTAAASKVVNSIVTGSEYITANNSDNTTFVTSLYNNVLGRDPDGGGLDFWVNELDTQAMTETQVATAFVYSNEGQTSTDSIVVINAIPVTPTTYYFGSPSPNGTIFGAFGTSKKGQLENLLQNDVVAYLENNNGGTLNVFKSRINWNTDHFLVYNGRVPNS
jgi:hypothetical protein